MPTTVDTMSMFEASRVASEFECVAMLKVSKMKNRSSQVESNVQRLQFFAIEQFLSKFEREVARFVTINSERRQIRITN